jgi:hypothetical protein
LGDVARKAIDVHPGYVARHLSGFATDLVRIAYAMYFKFIWFWWSGS